MKKTVLFLGIIALMFSFTACGPKEDEGMNFTLVLPMGSNEVWNDCAEGFKDACEKLGIIANVVSPSTPNDANEMNALIEAAIANGTDGVMTQAVAPEAQSAVFKKLDEEGIPYCLVNSDASDSGRLGFIGTGDALGHVGAEAVLENFTDDEKIVFASALFSLSAPIAISLHNAYLDVLKGHKGGFEEIVVIDTKGDQMTGTTEWKNAFMTYPEINAGMNIDGFAGLGVAQAMKELDIPPGEIAIIAIDFVPATLDGIKDGYLYGTMTQNFYRMGYEPVVWLDEFIKSGAKPAKKVNDSGTILVTKDNIDTFTLEMRDPTKWN